MSPTTGTGDTASAAASKGLFCAHPSAARPAPMSSASVAAGVRVGTVEAVRRRRTPRTAGPRRMADPTGMGNGPRAM
jgi:hypothetical protein